MFLLFTACLGKHTQASVQMSNITSLASHSRTWVYNIRKNLKTLALLHISQPTNQPIFHWWWKINLLSSQKFQALKNKNLVSIISLAENHTPVKTKFSTLSTAQGFSWVSDQISLRGAAWLGFYFKLTLDYSVSFKSECCKTNNSN